MGTGELVSLRAAPTLSRDRAARPSAFSSSLSLLLLLPAAESLLLAYHSEPAHGAVLPRFPVFASARYIDHDSLCPARQREDHIRISSSLHSRAGSWKMTTYPLRGI